MTRDEGEVLESMRDSIKQFEDLPDAAEDDETTLNFDTLWEINPEIIGWIEFDVTKIDVEYYIDEAAAQATVIDQFY